MVLKQRQNLTPVRVEWLHGLCKLYLRIGKPPRYYLVYVYLFEQSENLNITE